MKWEYNSDGIIKFDLHLPKLSDNCLFFRLLVFFLFLFSVTCGEWRFKSDTFYGPGCIHSCIHELAAALNDNNSGYVYGV